jgi:signal transduction histidine kinase/ActR/RegA family two-component response regulator
MPQNAATSTTASRSTGRGGDVLRLLRGLCEAARQTAGADHAWAGLLGADGAAFLQSYVSGSVIRKAWKGEAHPIVTDLLRDLIEGRGPRLHGLDASAEVFGMPPSARVQLVVAIATPTQAYGCLCLGGDERAAFSSAQEWLVHQLATRLAHSYERALRGRSFPPGRWPATLLPPRPEPAAPARIEEERRRSQRMMEVGRLAGEVAHDFNNQLTTILGHGEMVLRQLPAESPLHLHVRGMLDAVDRAAGLTRQLQTFSRRQAAQLRVLDLNVAVTEMVRMLGRIVDERIQLSTALAPGLDPLEADPGLLEQVIVNLVVDVRDTIGGAGRIHVETARWSSADAATLTPLPLRRDGRYALLVVTGSGPDLGVAPRTRGLAPAAGMTPLGGRSGIGLAAMRGIVEQLGGHLAVVAGPGNKTVFRVWLPSLDGERPAVPGADSGAVLLRGTETLLLVEDEPAVRELEACVLREQGYCVLEAADGQEALEMLQGPLEPVPDLLVTDLAMPRLGGRALADLARGLHPRMRILCISGDAGEVETTDELPDTAMALLHKPFTIEELTGKVREALEGAAG